MNNVVYYKFYDPQSGKIEFDTSDHTFLIRDFYEHIGIRGFKILEYKICKNKKDIEKFCK